MMKAFFLQCLLLVASATAFAPALFGMRPVSTTRYVREEEPVVREAPFFAEAEELFSGMNAGRGVVAVDNPYSLFVV
jgi:hypothetical protein